MWKGIISWYVMIVFDSCNERWFLVDNFNGFSLTTWLFSDLSENITLHLHCYKCWSKQREEHVTVYAGWRIINNVIRMQGWYFIHRLVMILDFKICIKMIKCLQTSSACNKEMETRKKEKQTSCCVIIKKISSLNYIPQDFKKYLT